MAKSYVAGRADEDDPGPVAHRHFRLPITLWPRPLNYEAPRL